MKDADRHPLTAGRWTDRLRSPRAMAVLALASVAFLIVAGVGLWYVFLRSPGTRLDLTPAPDFTPPPSLGELAAQYPELAHLLDDPELDSAYKDFLIAYEQGGFEAALDLARRRGMLNARGELRLTLELDTDQSERLAQQLEGLGAIVEGSNGRLMDVAIPPPVLELAVQSDDPGRLFAQITELEHVVRVRLPRPRAPVSGSTGEESLKVIGADEWHAAGLTGEGIKIGILDLGFDGYRDLLGSELPDRVTGRSFITGWEIDEAGTEHGTAVAEVVHDVAPDAELFLAAYYTDAGQQQAVEWLLDQGVLIISHSVGSVVGPMNGTGAEAQFVDSVHAQGIFWVNSAGNEAQTHYRAEFADADGDGFHEFLPDQELMGLLPDDPNELVSVALNWDDWVNGSEDYDLFIYDDEGELVVSSTDIQDGGDEAAEWTQYIFGDDRIYYIAVEAVQTTRSAVLDLYVYDAEIEFTSPEHSLVSPADARGAFAVGATFWDDDSLAAYSSRGPSNDGRLKPELTAPTGIGSSTYRVFAGTSASAPHVAGAAALILQAFPDLTPDDLAEYLIGHAVDVGPEGPDPAYGYGRLELGEPPVSATVATATAELPPTALPSVTPFASEAPLPTRVPVPTQAPILARPARRDLIWLLAGGAAAAFGLLGAAGFGLLVVLLLFTRRRPPFPGQAGNLPAPAAPAKPQYGLDKAAPESPRPSEGQRCPRCQVPHHPNVRFCSNCGLALQVPVAADRPADRRCRYCGQELRPIARFCPRCGKPQ